MLWHGTLNKPNIYKLDNKNSQIKKNKNLYKYKFLNNQKYKYNKFIFSYICPSHHWNIVVLNNLHVNLYYIILYSKNYFIKIPVSALGTVFFYDKITQQLVLSTSYLKNYNTLYKTIITRFYVTLLTPVFQKLKFKGKGYYIYKNYRNTITPQFGYSHRLYLYGFYLNVVFLSKTSLIVFGLNVSHVSYVSSKLLKWRPVNIFTGRGIRFSKQLIYKKSGKVSTYR